MPTLGPPELIIIFLIVLLIFGASKLPALGQSLGEGIRNFRKGLRGGDRPEAPEETGDKSPGA